jgi:hypothetical protein
MRMGTCNACGKTDKLLEGQVYIDGLKSDLCDACRVKLCICGRCSAWVGGHCHAQRPIVACYSYNDPCAIFPGIGSTERCRDTWEQKDDWTRAEVEAWIT